MIFDFRFFLGGADMAQEPLKELIDNLLSIFKEIAASEYEEQRRRIDSLEKKVDKIYFRFRITKAD